jgi:hypothetical protein
MKSKSIHGVKTGNHSNPNVVAAAKRSGGAGGWKPGNATERPSGGMFASGGAVRGKQSEDDGKGGWVSKDGSARPSGASFSKGGRTKC